MKIQTVFKRVEKKYLLNREQYLKILDITAPYMDPDGYGKTTVCNIYFDSPCDELIINSIEKPVYKEKFRIRSYGVAEKDSAVFLEIKKKLGGVVYKRRIALPIDKAEEYIRTGTLVWNEGNNIPYEIDYMIHHYLLSPKVYIAYDRTAYFGKNNRDLRITFDENIRSRYDNLTLKSDGGCTPLLEKGQYLMEIKIPGAMPLWLSRALSENGIFPTGFSKYGNVHKQSLDFRVQSSKCNCGRVGRMD